MSRTLHTNPLYPIGAVLFDAYKDIARAHKLFLDYGGDKFFMDRDGVLSEYEEFNISSEIEMEWMKEFLNIVLYEFKHSENDDMVFSASMYMKTNSWYFKKDSLTFIRRNEAKLTSVDDFSRLRLLEDISRYSLPPSLGERFKIANKSINELKMMLKRKLVIDPVYLDDIGPHNYLKEDVLRERIKDLIFVYRKARLGFKIKY
jgi:hypothetical protein